MCTRVAPFGLDEHGRMTRQHSPSSPLSFSTTTTHLVSTAEPVFDESRQGYIEKSPRGRQAEDNSRQPAGLDEHGRMTRQHSPSSPLSFSTTTTHLVAMLEETTPLEIGCVLGIDRIKFKSLSFTRVTTGQLAGATFEALA
jgi:hypothetical protein